MTDTPESVNLSDVSLRKVDTELLNELRDLFARAEDQKERYDFTWNGKAKAYFEAATPTTKTLRPQPEESYIYADDDYKEKVNTFNDSENLFITGDNLDALKLLQESYLGKIDMIYIDPPYNTGKDFVYHDNFKSTQKDTDVAEGSVDEDGNRLVKNEKNSGRYHSDWLSMMYPRLKLARNLLSDSGVIFVSIDDNEQANLKLLMDGVFGEANFLATIIWERAYAPINLMKNFSVSHDYLVGFAKNINLVETNGITRGQEADGRYKNPDNDPRGDWKSSDLSVGPAVASNIYQITTPSGRIVEPPAGRSWRLSEKAFSERLADNRIWFGTSGNNVPSMKRFKSELRKSGITPMTIWKHNDVGHSQSATQYLADLMGGKKYFDYPKPVALIERIVDLYSKQDSIILDFFAGSATTAESVMSKNNSDEGNRKYVIVQLGEKLNEHSDAKKDGYSTIDQISRERIRRAAKKLGDTSGFRALKVDKTGLKEDVFKTAGELTQENLQLDVDNQADVRSDYDLLYDVLVDGALEYNRQIATETISNEPIIKYDYLGELSGVIAYFGDNLTNELTREIAKLKPLIAVFKESTFNNSSDKVNVLEQFRVISPETKVKVI
ncbi:MAG: site-specific DNA-methyltransferase [Leuconostoc mesenteroides]